MTEKRFSFSYLYFFWLWCHFPPTSPNSILPLISQANLVWSTALNFLFVLKGKTNQEREQRGRTWLDLNGWIFFFSFIYLLYNIVLILPHIDMNLHGCTCAPHPERPLPPPAPSHPSGSSQCTSHKHPVSWIKRGNITYDNLHVSMPFSHIIPPSPSSTKSKRLFYIFVSLLLSRIYGYHYHLSKFHIYVLVYGIGISLSGLLHSV